MTVEDGLRRRLRPVHERGQPPDPGFDDVGRADTAEAAGLEHGRELTTVFVEVLHLDADGTPGGVHRSATACCRTVSDSGPVKVCTAPTCPDDVSAQAATAAMSASWTSAACESGKGSRTTPSARIDRAQTSRLAAKPPGRTNVHGIPESRTACSASPWARVMASSDAGSAPAADSTTTCARPPARARKPPSPAVPA